MLDAELLLTKLENIMKSKLNDKITQIQAEKDALLGDKNYEMKLLDDTAWFDSLDEETANYDPFIYFGITSPDPIAVGGATAQEIGFFFTVVTSYDNESNINYRRCLRYIRALTEVVNENFDKVPATSNFEVSTLSPRDLRDIEFDTRHKICGIEVSTTIA